MSNLHRWDSRFAGLEHPVPFADSPSYRLGAEWLAGCELIADWGCGRGWMRLLVDHERYIGIDGSLTPFADVLADLTEYRARTPGIFMRHVLEHNFEWRRVLDNALASFTERMALILFTPFSDRTHDMAFEDPPGVPNLSFRLGDLTERFEAAGVSATLEGLGNEVRFGPHEERIGTETILRLWR